MFTCCIIQHCCAAMAGSVMAGSELTGSMMTLSPEVRLSRQAQLAARSMNSRRESSADLRSGSVEQS
jgi:hypothetical protein